MERFPDEDFQTPAQVSQAFKGPSSDDVQAFDRRFMEQNLRYHENDLKVFRHYAEQSEGPVKDLADAGVKLFGKHLNMLKELSRKQKK